MRDPPRFRRCALAEAFEDASVLASETCALDLIHAKISPRRQPHIVVDQMLTSIQAPSSGAAPPSAISNTSISPRPTVDLAAELKRIFRFRCRIVIQSDPEYPDLLRQIYDPPIVLYVKGALTEGQKLGRDGGLTADDALRNRNRAETRVPTGLPWGDGRQRRRSRHRHGCSPGALYAKGRTIAVLGTGINLIPPENLKLFERIAANGALVTQFPFNRPGDKQLPHPQPHRRRHDPWHGRRRSQPHQWCADHRQYG